MQRFYIYGPGIDEPVMIYNVTTASIYLYMYDRLGNVAGLLNYTTGALVERYEYDVFGKATVHTSAGADGEWMTDDDVTSSTSSVGNPYMFTGRRYDSEIDKYYYRARYYDADTGRFLSPDPIGYYDSMNLYQYVINNPLNWIDPWGLTEKECEIEELINEYNKSFINEMIYNSLDDIAEHPGTLTGIDFVDMTFTITQFNVIFVENLCGDYMGMAEIERMRKEYYLKKINEKLEEQQKKQEEQRRKREAERERKAEDEERRRKLNETFRRNIWKNPEWTLRNVRFI
jgi:RHS repeat-associated protein